ncbi:uncharacterized protein LOC119668915 isoform X1 [Teleopsis dalmanni]|uniref:uncharacterized protein LOC119668915 isoform X1 n=1 Tax=Teleopsis dalmanni TaxID=139649 RepID=UPI0018CEE3BF|nr:uncharacterized protein LOC119668915 isoform X1 [Teleopsis dalmanni]
MSPIKRNPLFFVAFLFFIISTPTTDALIEDVLDIIHVVKEVSSTILRAWDIVQQSNLVNGIDFPLMREKQKKVLTRLKEVSRQIANTEEKYAENVALAIQSVNSFVANNVALLTKMNDVENTMNSISARFQEMQQYEKRRDKLEISTLIMFAEWTVAPNAYSIRFLMNRLHLTLFGTEEKTNSSTNFLTQLARSYEESANEICHTQQSPQQFVYSLYADIAMTELKGYALMEFSWMMLRIYGKGNFTEESELMRSDYQKRTERTLKLLREVMLRSSRNVWHCDPDKYVKGETYEEVTRLLQGYIENEVDMNNDETCREDCAFYISAKSEGCFKNKYCARQPKCSGRLYSCRYLDSDMWICPSPLNSTRRYEWIEYENGRILGKAGYCTRGTTKVDSWWRYLLWHCSYCFCLCDEQGLKSDRYFNLRDVVSDVEENKVVTGLRFVKKNRVFHLQIQQGELQPRGSINASNISWKPTNNYNIFDRDVKNGRDYHTLSYESRSIDLDDVHTEDISYIVTGVRFRVMGTHLNLEARFSEFNFKTGELVSPEINSFWKSNDNTDVSGNRRTKIRLNSPDISIRTIVKSLPNSKDNDYIDFVNSDMDKDAAQSTVPFIDTQGVVSKPPVPLAGVGIYHKTQNGYGGFVGPKIETYDFAPHVQLPTHG